MSGTWVPYTNEKLFLAKLQLDLMESPELADKAPQRESTRQASVLLMQQAWVGLLNEIGESFSLKNVRLQSLADLEQALGGSTSEVAPLLALYEDPQSWVRLLLRDYEATTRPKPKGAPVQAGNEPGLILSHSDHNETRSRLLLQDLKEYVTAFRDRTHEW